MVSELTQGWSWTIGQTASPPVAGRADGGAPAGTTAQPGSTPVGGGGAPPPNPWGGAGMLYILGFFVLLMIVMQVFGGRKERKRRAEMLGGLKRHDRVQTVGGIIGSVAEVRDDEVVLKVDEATNTKIRVAKTAVQAVLKRSEASLESAGAATEGARA